jgi:hypothetical protein
MPQKKVQLEHPKLDGQLITVVEAALPEWTAAGWRKASKKSVEQATEAQSNEKKG